LLKSDRGTCLTEHENVWHDGTLLRTQTQYAGTFIVKKSSHIPWIEEDIKSSYLSVDKAICDLLPDFIGAKKYDEWLKSKTVYYPSIFENPEDVHEFKRMFLKNTKDIYVVKLGVLLSDSLCILDGMLDYYTTEELGISQILKRKREISFRNLPILGYDIMGYDRSPYESAGFS
jgi:hypothetical protein